MPTSHLLAYPTTGQEPQPVQAHPGQTIGPKSGALIQKMTSHLQHCRPPDGSAGLDARCFQMLDVIYTVDLSIQNLYSLIHSNLSVGPVNTMIYDH